ncbi:MAG: His-Xaa-Ser system protein HxsD [Candidatus Omnitrophica bacterium CG23_combo_of_CG06-09_8_20_14_all_41_10]|uniref:His-Xaa-Ser system protein HxsD n=1 Tax=Candidatus Sherwoodlollariibacterium unditelluris TaxID=1974757 RepID=A0A2G9YJU6_9BACT|nr:MAG: His-Xaa-Ser system protein HxsD [Candidatus Omnitrophica bacterium CG23_combo_of_CG06-09_8_20_14_all_41_10]
MLIMKHKILKDQNKVIFSVNPNLYSLEAVYGACYVFIDRTYIFLDGDPQKEIKVFIKGKDKLSLKAFNNLVGEFQNELLNYALRERINKNNRKIREYIVGRALFSASDLLPEEKTYDYQKDPLGIAIPWEEKYGKDKAK